jgi:flagellar biosynthesis protein FlhG
MPDQADKLRELIRFADGDSRAEPQAAVGSAMVVVAGGRAGVGVTTLAVNLGVVLAERVGRVLVVDAAEEGGDLVAAAGVRRRVEYGLADVMEARCGIGEAMVEGPGQVMLLAKGRGLTRKESASSPRRIFDRRDAATGGQRLMDALDSLCSEVELVVVDVGSGVSAWSRRFWLRAGLVVLVTTADGAAVLDSYAMLKRCAVDASGPEVRMVVNRCEHERRAAEAQRRFANACERFLGRTVPSLPSLPYWEGHESSGRNAFAGGSTANKLAVAPANGTWPRVWEGADNEFGHAMMWLGRAVGDLLRIEDAGCGEQGFDGSSFPESCIPHPAS